MDLRHKPQFITQGHGVGNQFSDLTCYIEFGSEVNLTKKQLTSGSVAAQRNAGRKDSDT